MRFMLLALALVPCLLLAQQSNSTTTEVLIRPAVASGGPDLDYRTPPTVSLLHSIELMFANGLKREEYGGTIEVRLKTPKGVREWKLTGNPQYILNVAMSDLQIGRNYFLTRRNGEEWREAGYIQVLLHGPDIEIEKRRPLLRRALGVIILKE